MPSKNPRNAGHSHRIHFGQCHRVPREPKKTPLCAKGIKGKPFLVATSNDVMSCTTLQNTATLASYASDGSSGFLVGSKQRLARGGEMCVVNCVSFLGRT